jgi:hypothetical protein
MAMRTVAAEARFCAHFWTLADFENAQATQSQKMVGDDRLELPTSSV